MSIELGKFNTLRVVKEVDFGMYLDGGEEGEILLPSRYVPENCKPGDGLTDDITKQADTLIRIPMQGEVESLNAAIACTILTYEAVRQRSV